jgi:hypothetical protein
LSGTLQKILRQMLHTKPMSTMFRWQKQAARKSTEMLVGRMRCVREEGEGRKAVMMYVRRLGWGEFGDEGGGMRM